MKGLLNSADKISQALGGEFQPRKVLGQKYIEIESFSPSKIRELGIYQGRVVLVALAAELALKFVWESENTSKVAEATHNLDKLFRSLSPNLQEIIETDYKSRVTDSRGKEWSTTALVFKTCKNAFDDWRYIVEEGKAPGYIMRATYLKDATLSVIQALCNLPIAHGPDLAV